MPRSQRVGLRPQRVQRRSAGRAGHRSRRDRGSGVWISVTGSCRAARRRAGAGQGAARGGGASPRPVQRRGRAPASARPAPASPPAPARPVRPARPAGSSAGSASATARSPPRRRAAARVRITSRRRDRLLEVMRRQADPPFRQQSARRSSASRGSARGRAAGRSGQMPSFSPPRITRSAPCTRASSVPQIRMPGCAACAGSRHLAARQDRVEQVAVVGAGRAPCRRARPRAAARHRPPARARARRARPTAPLGLPAGSGPAQALGQREMPADVVGQRRASPARSSRSRVPAIQSAQARPLGAVASRRSAIRSSAPGRAALRGAAAAPARGSSRRCRPRRLPDGSADA